MNRLKELTERFRREVEFYKDVLAHERTPRLSRWLLAAALFYASMPIDIIPDFIPVLGHLDDMIIVPGLVALALKMIPKDVIQECRSRQRLNPPS